MKHFLLCSLIVTAFGFAGSRSVSAADVAADAAIKAAQLWLALEDSANDAGAWDQAAYILKNQFTKKEWEERLNSSRVSLGKVDSRTLTSTVFYIKSLPNAPRSECVTIQYETIYTNGKTSVETLTLSKEADEQWRVSGYFVNR